jgi:hypothetical protein
MPRSRSIAPGITGSALAFAAAAFLFAGPVPGRSATPSSAGPSAQTKSRDKTREKKPGDAARPGRPSGTPKIDPSGGGDGLDAGRTITAHRNARGETVFSVAPSQFDVSEPLGVMAARMAPPAEAEEESPTNPLLPSFRVPHGPPDPVTQPAPGSDMEALRVGPITLEAPSVGFDFVGTAQSGVVPPDTNGSVGNNQFVETANVRYQVWSLDHVLKTATSVFGPVAINALWSTFGGPCQAQNSGDPIVLYDKLANRWLISQFTATLSGGSYFQCVAISTSADAGSGSTWFRYAFAVPSAVFGDYPHFGVWTDAYYMMAHGFTSSLSTGTYVGGIFAALDRTKMLAGDPTATWQVIIDPNEGGHMPADLDGVTPPPTGAPGVFLSIHGSAMVFYRMKVDFVNPANTVRTLQGTAPVAAVTGACFAGAATPGTCIPQPGTTRLLDSLGDRLMFRAAYRNFIDHESIVISHSVDPSIAGLVSGVRWYDFRLSGMPDAVCSTFPCTRQQGTVADVAGGRNRWMPSIAMDGAENILVGYSTSGKTNLSENQSIRYTGRAKNDPLGQMTVPEGTIVTGIHNNSNNSRWGDYTSVSVDPFDDCTLFHANEYYVTADNSWSTRITSVTWPVGTGDGQCAPTTCPSRPSAAPLIGTATAPGPNQIQVTWTGIAPPAGAYAIERAPGACGSEGLYQPLAATPGANSAFTDTTVEGGLTYSYRVIAAADAAGKCQASVASGCVSATASGVCDLKPLFGGAVDATSNDNQTCGVVLHWNAATSSCPLTPNIRYNIYRGTTPDFTPSAASRIAVCAPGPSSYLDTSALQSGVTYYYVARAEDDSTAHGGPCGGGNEEQNGVIVGGTAFGAGLQASPGSWIDNGGDGTALLRLNVAGTGDTPDRAWRYIKTANDSGANHTAGGAYAYRNAGPTSFDIYQPMVCAEIQTPPIVAGGATVDLTYWERHQLEYHWDGIVVEYARNGGPWTTVPTPSNDPALGCTPTDTLTNWETLSCTGSPPANACGYAATQKAIDGPVSAGTACASWVTSTAVTSYAHRCHPVTGLVAGDTLQFRWRFTSDPGAEFAGFYLDDVGITNILLPNACTPASCGGQPDGTPCNDGNACTQTDTCQQGTCVGSNPVVCAPLDACHDAGVCSAGVCSNPQKPDGASCDDGNACTTGTTCTSGACGGGTLVLPPAVNDTLAFDAAGTTLSWNDPPGNWNVYRGSGTNGTPWAFNQVCFDPHKATSSSTDASSPPLNTFFFYLVTRVNACGESSPGTDSAGNPRPNPAPCP